ncbi:type I glyceraldehyde-3-phosphate dehydrogenase [Candidatus Dependentiae bacterium]|nr:type I glyceraldehyde-3-phosphate dehydrogenase [Candidatus Dependentiae bacterium]
MINIAINGFGRIGKTFLRTLLAEPECFKKITVAVINVGKGDIQAAAYALKYDTIMGTLPQAIEYKNGKLYIDSYSIDVITELDPEKAPWKAYGIDWVVEASGHFTKQSGAQKHILAGAKKVLITAPADGEDITIIPGTNSNLYDASKHTIVSLGSCTTNALVTMLTALSENFDLAQVSMTTIHAYTNTQPLLDVDASVKDLRRGRAAALNIVPTTTGAMSLIERIMPHLAGKIMGGSLRVPVATVSLVDLTFTATKPVSVESINKAFEQASNTTLKHILGFTREPLVSSDYTGNNNSVTIDSLLTDAQDTTGKVFGWYDNEWGYSCRLKDFLLSIA